MLQRIQTVFWLLSFVLLFILFNSGKLALNFLNESFYLSYLLIIICVLNIVTIGLFRNRKMQQTLSIIALVLLGLILLIFVINHGITNVFREHILTIGLILVGLIFNFTALYFLNKDINLLKSSSRLR